MQAIFIKRIKELTDDIRLNIERGGCKKMRSLMENTLRLNVRLAKGI